jgi:2-keto-4-pentenoate hydratase/2-oxohepta-3-ene-1,7-dioic acid hydratase in catechol pathway
VGRTARHIAKADAHKVIAGYACFNDGSVRDYQRKTAQWTIGKNFDKTGGFGPWFVSADELPPGAVGLSIKSLLNGQVMQNANTRDMIFDIATLVATASEAMTLEAGDVCEVEIEGVGLLSNPIKDEK